MKNLRKKKNNSSVSGESSLQLSIRCSPEEAAVLDSAYRLYASRVGKPESKSRFLKSLMLSALNLDEPDENIESESYVISKEKVVLVKELSDELNLLINNLDDEKETMVSLSKVVRHLKLLTGYRHLPESEMVSTPVDLLNHISS